MGWMCHVRERVLMGNRFDAYLAGRVATEPTLGTTKDGQPWVRFRLAVDDRSQTPRRASGRSRRPSSTMSSRSGVWPNAQSGRCTPVTL